MNTFSQSSQDLFVINTLKDKQGGSFLEIGANHPINHSNTYLLEENYGWRGIMVEYERTYEKEYKIHRPQSIIILDDARKVDYRKILDENSFPKDLDYLQVDLEVNNRSTLDTLEKLDETIFGTYRFATVTFEHDIYTGDYFNTRQKSRELFDNQGYILVFPDVKVYWDNKWSSYEDWYIHSDLIDADYVQKLKTDESLGHDEIIRRIKSWRN